MYLIFFIDLISSLLLIGAFYTVWKERNHFYSLRPILPAVAFLSVGRLCDMLVEHPSIRLSNIFGLTPESFEMSFSVMGNITDVIGISLLIFGFVKIIKYEKEEKQHIKNLETFLPICSNCKKYRTDDNQWVPIEQYLFQMGAAKVSHGICPECKDKLYGEFLNKKKK
jgi:hypothetical protein